MKIIILLISAATVASVASAVSANDEHERGLRGEGDATRLFRRRGPGGGRGWRYRYGYGGGLGGMGGMGGGGMMDGGGGMGGMGGGGGMMGGGGGMGGGMGTHHEAMQTIHNLFDNHELIHRSKNETTTGIKSYTWSTDDDVSGWIKDHVTQMRDMMLTDDESIRWWDPLFRLAFQMRDYHDMVIDDVDLDGGGGGVRVVHEPMGDLSEAEEECVTELIWAHAEVVSDFVRYGWDEAMESHPIPDAC